MKNIKENFDDEEKKKLAKYGNSYEKTNQALFDEINNLDHKYFLFNSSQELIEVIHAFYGEKLNQDDVFQELFEKYHTNNYMKDLEDSIKYVRNKYDEKIYKDYLIQLGKADDSYKNYTEEEKEKFFEQKRAEHNEEYSKFDSEEIKAELEKRKKWDKSKIFSSWTEIKKVYPDYETALNTLTKENLEHDYKADPNFDGEDFEYVTPSTDLNGRVKEIKNFMFLYENYYKKKVTEIKKLIQKNDLYFKKEGGEPTTLYDIIKDNKSNVQNWIDSTKLKIYKEKMKERNPERNLDSYTQKPDSIKALKQDLHFEKYNAQQIRNSEEIKQLMAKYSEYYTKEHITYDSLIKESKNSYLGVVQNLKIGILCGEINEMSKENLYNKNELLLKPDKAVVLNQLEQFKNGYINEFNKLTNKQYIDTLFDDFIDRNPEWKNKELIHLFNHYQYNAERTYRALVLSEYKYYYPKEEIPPDDEQASDNEIRKNNEKKLAKIIRVSQRHEIAINNERIKQKVQELEISESDIGELYSKYKTDETVEIPFPRPSCPH